jgi:hypothetical protein
MKRTNKLPPPTSNHQQLRNKVKVLRERQNLCFEEKTKLEREAMLYTINKYYRKDKYNK